MAVLRICGFDTLPVQPYPFIDQIGSLGSNLRSGHGGYITLAGERIVLSASEEDDFIVLGNDIAPTGDNRGWTFRGDDNAVTHLTVVWRSATAKWEVWRGASGTGTLLGASPGNSHVGSTTVKYLEIKFRIADATGFVELWLDNVQVLNLTGIDTKNGGADALIDTITQPATPFTCDNLIVINEVAGNGAVDRVGPIYVAPYRPNGNGTASWDGSDGNQTDNYLLVDDPALNNDGDTTYLETGVAEVEILGVADISPTPVTIVAVDAIMIAKDSVGGGTSARPGYRIGGTNYPGDPAVLTASYAAYGKAWGVSPATAVAWTRTEFNGAELTAESL